VSWAIEDSVINSNLRGEFYFSPASGCKCFVNVALFKSELCEDCDDVIPLLAKVGGENCRSVPPLMHFVVGANKSGKKIKCHAGCISSKQTAGSTENQIAAVDDARVH
jgi:hypothetical protein